MKKSQKIVNCALFAAIYVALCAVFQSISFGPIQFRFAEILCLFSIDYFWAFIGVTIGCFLSNTFFGGLGIADMIFGTLATVIGCLLAYLFRNVRYKGNPFLSASMIVIANAIIIGIELGYILSTPDLIPLYMLQVGIGELVVLAIGLPLYKRIKIYFDTKLSDQN
ncbi:MAG: QueT transporter family protein [Erysipelotrichaceae bacterium]|nr:QueT transporter family protein [Erysipelotrichaceae bacterium]